MYHLDMQADVKADLLVATGKPITGRNTLGSDARDEGVRIGGGG